jgi:hypothetical protein
MANTAAVLSLSLGKKFPQLIGEDLLDCLNARRHGITTVAIAILKSTRFELNQLRERLKAYEADLTMIDLTTHTQSTGSYQEYAQKLKSTPIDELQYQGIALYGNAKLVNKFSGNLALLR